MYIRREAAVRASGNRLGPVGGRIVADVLVGLLDRENVERTRGAEEQSLTDFGARFRP